ncbi:MAG: uroporphyrinogen-III synthase [Proteobacteria bacterium]|nr:uroporphyrinogen-III synthase [Pseudomonadota bacterium]
MRILITRPQEDAVAFAARLADCGVESLVVPLMEIVFEPAAGADLDGIRAVLLTSANGARALAAAGSGRDLPVIAVGPATAQAARQAGFAVMAVAGGDVVALARTVCDTLKPDDGTLLHVCGSVVAGDLAAALGGAGYTVRRFTAYQARTARVLPDDLAAVLRAGTADGAAFFSPRSAATFVRLTREAGLGGTLERLAGYCLSEAVARELTWPVWGVLRVASSPDGEALARLICADAERP